jgi:hypothetical protein
MKARKMATPTKRMSGVTLRGHALQTLHLVDRMVNQSSGLFPDLLGRQIRAVQVVRRRSFALHIPVPSPVKRRMGTARR